MLLAPRTPGRRSALAGSTTGPRPGPPPYPSFTPSDAAVATSHLRWAQIAGPDCFKRVLECHSKNAHGTSRLIDLRTEVATRPTPEMWRAMEEAEIGWAQKGEDAQVNRLEQLGAELTGQEAALFVFTASLANLLALIVGTRRGDHVILEADMHMVWIEGWNLSYICGLYPQLIPSEQGELSLETVEETLTAWRGPAHPRPSLVAIEDPHNDHGGTIVSAGHVADLAALAHRHGARVHMDG